MKPAIAAAVMFCLLLPFEIRAEGDSLEAVEKDLSAVIKEMDAMSAELDRIQDMASVPKTTYLRMEITGGTGVSAPVSARLIINGKVEHEQEWSRTEREAFLAGSTLLFQVPLLPGAYAARFEIANPSWKSPPAFDFQADIRKGETLARKLRLSLPAGAKDPILASAAER
jgi:hypothetical protein